MYAHPLSEPLPRTTLIACAVPTSLVRAAYLRCLLAIAGPLLLLSRLAAIALAARTIAAAGVRVHNEITFAWHALVMCLCVRLWSWL